MQTTPLRKPWDVYPVRLAPSIIQALKKLARRKGVQHTSLVRRWVAIGLIAESGESPDLLDAKHLKRK